MAAGPSARGLVLEDEIGTNQPAAGRQEMLEEGGSDSEQRVGHHPVGPPREPQGRSVSLDDENLRPEPPSKMVDPVRVDFDRDHPSGCLEEDSCDRPVACPYVEDHAAGNYAGVSAEALRPSRVDLVPSPPR